MLQPDVTPTTPAEVEEEEPRLKYQRLGASVSDILEKDPASCLCVSDKILALGTHDGTLHILDIHGNEVKTLSSHKAVINDICFDEQADFVASCSDDGSVSISGLYTEEVAVFQYGRPVKTIAVDPRYASRKTREFVTGGLAGQLILNSRGWLGSKDSVVHSGEGPIHVARWSGNYIAWANDLGVKVYDASIHRRIAFFGFERPAGSPVSMAAALRLRCHLFWEGDSTLFMGWADVIKIAKVRSTATSSTDGAKSVDVVASLRMDCIVSGLAPFGQDLAVLAYMLKPPTAAGHADDNGSADASLAGSADRPELKIVTWQNEDLASDALTIHGFEFYEATDYALATCDPLGRQGPPVQTSAAGTASGPHTRSTGEWLPNGREPLYYIISPKDVVAGRLRSSADRIAWLLEHSRFEQALHVADSDSSLKASVRQQVVHRYLDYLMKQGKAEEAAKLCPDLLKGDASMWERQVYLFAQRRQLAALALYIPTKDPRLRGTAYRMVLDAFLLSAADHPRLLSLLHTWPPDLYSLPALTEAVVHRVYRPGGDSAALLQCAAHLYQAQGRFDLALKILLRLQRPDVFDFITGNGLLALLKGPDIVQLLRIDESRALHLLADHAADVPPSVTVPALQAAVEEADHKETAGQGGAEGARSWRRRLHEYLDRLFRADATAASEFHGLQVGLYAEFAPAQLMSFLVSSQSYALGEAYELCAAAGLVREQVFILGRMGNAREALQLIIDQLGDIPQAIDFVQMQGDDELWELLITLALGSAESTGELMDHVGGYINPLALVSRIPPGLAIPRLRNRLVGIIADFRTQTSLREGCNAILTHDCLMLAQRLYSEVRRALRGMYIQLPAEQTPAAARSFPVASTSTARSSTPAAAPPQSLPQWFSYSVGASLRRTQTAEQRISDPGELPGPHGGKQVHIQPRSRSSVSLEAVLPQVWIGMGDAAPKVAELKQQSYSGLGKYFALGSSGDDNGQPALASLLDGL